MTIRCNQRQACPHENGAERFLPERHLNITKRSAQLSAFSAQPKKYKM